jgi:hypothetical protein
MRLQVQSASIVVHLVGQNVKAIPLVLLMIDHAAIMLDDFSWNHFSE